MRADNNAENNVYQVMQHDYVNNRLEFNNKIIQNWGRFFDTNG